MGKIAKMSVSHWTVFKLVSKHKHKMKPINIKDMITDLSNGRLDEIIAFANEHGLTESYEKTFARLERHSENGCQVKIYSDFAPLSLYFEITRDGLFVLNGGFIFHGPHDGYGNGGAPTFSVCIEPEKQPGWSIHT